MSGDEKPRRSHPFMLGIDRLGLVALSAPYVAAAVILALTALSMVGLSRLKVDDSLSELFRTNTAEFRQYEEVDRRFPSSEYDVLAVIEGRELLGRKQIGETKIIDGKLNVAYRDPSGTHNLTYDGADPVAGFRITE